MTKPMETMSFKQLITKGKYSWVNDSITEVDFPKEEIRGEVEIFDPKTSFTFEEGLELLKKEGLEPANAWELFNYGATHFQSDDEKPFIFAFGTDWLDPHRSRRIVYLDRSSDSRKLGLDCPDGGFSDDCVLAGVRLKSSDTEDLKTLESLLLRINELEKFRDSVEKILKLK